MFPATNGGGGGTGRGSGGGTGTAGFEASGFDEVLSDGLGMLITLNDFSAKTTERRQHSPVAVLVKDCDFNDPQILSKVV